MRFRVARALGGGLATWRELGDCSWSEFCELAGYADYEDLRMESLLARAGTLAHWNEQDRKQYLKKIQEGLEAVLPEEEVKEKRELERRLQELNARIFAGMM